MMNIATLTFDTIDSTNTETMKHARHGAAEGLCIIARQQTAGRGRYGRTWASPIDAGLYFSIVLRPKLESRFLPIITLMSGVAVHDTLVEFGARPDIKWVNDVLIEEKKVSGILAETTETADGLAVIVGIGINLTSDNFPPEIAETATSMQEATGVAISPAKLAETLTKYLSYFYSILNGENGTTAILAEWRKRSSFYSGKAVKVAVENGVIRGLTDGLESNGALRVKTTDGRVSIIQAGDVQRLRAEEGEPRASPAT